ncbi:penicillin-binding protein 1C [Deltaproteobacteria bacterium OttesenSCG-928-K17]|nr:penicillin-binding protein 1C [Deltaproteobacteria bacterium OttesenSCG-928-K17]
MKIKLLKYMALAVGGLALFWLALGLWPNPLAEEDPWDWSVKVTDRHGRLLKVFLPPAAARREARPLEHFSPNLVAAVLTTEDKRFYHHPGLDPLALARAARLNLKHGRIVSGGSTITMQVARLNRGLSPGPRTFSRKFKEIWWALLIERHNTKDEILAEYLNRAPCGNLTEGFPAAARLYLNKSVADLSMAESAFLAALPASPGALNPYKDPRPALARRAGILNRLAARGYLPPEALARAKDEPLALSGLSSPFNAPHFVSYLRGHFGARPEAEITGTIDLELQRRIEELAEKSVDEHRDKGLDQAAVVVMSLKDREVLAWVGSVDFFDMGGGQNDGVTALRQPGSALKPFLYASAIESGLITPATLLDDSAADYRAPKGSFSPANYSGSFHGPVSARLALASSLNLPAVKLAEKVGVNKTLNLFRELGLNSLSHDADYYGLGLALGGGEVSLLDLTTAYAALADGGRWKAAVLTRPAPGKALPPDGGPGRQVFSEGAAYIITDILSDAQSRITGFGADSLLDTPYPAAVKTGTSKSFRDNWCLGYFGDFVIGVWAGNFESTPMDRVSGISGAGSIWRQVADLLVETRPGHADFKRPLSVTQARVCPVSGLQAGPDCPNHKLELFLSRLNPPPPCPHQTLNRQALGVSIPVVGLSRSFQLKRPVNGEIYAFDPGIARPAQHIKALGQSVPDVDTVVWKLNGREIDRQSVREYDRPTCLVPLSRGPARLEMIGLRGEEIIERSAVGYTVR